MTDREDFKHYGSGGHDSTAPIPSGTLTFGTHDPVQTIAALERRIEEQAKAMVARNEQIEELCANTSDLIDELDEIRNRHGGWLSIVDSIEDPADAITTFQAWRAAGYDGTPLRYRPATSTSPVADGPIATRFGAAKGSVLRNDDDDDPPPRTEAEHLHAAQLAAREHVVPHIHAAADAAARASEDDAAFAYLFIAALATGDLDPQIIRYARALIRFTEGGPPAPRVTREVAKAIRVEEDELDGPVCRCGHDRDSHSPGGACECCTEPGGCRCEGFTTP